MFKHMSMKQTGTLDDKTANYLEAVARETSQEIQAKLKAAVR